jgi:uncharacterized protein
MDTVLATSALVMGLTGSLHCTAMCGPVFGALAASPAKGAIPTALMSVHAGRLIGYAAAGALVATSASALGTLEAAGPLLRPAWTLIHVGATVLGLWLLWNGRVPRWLSSESPPRAEGADGQVVRVFRKLPASGRAGAAGLCWPGIPCGLLQSALLVAALASGPLQGAAVMGTFALASGAGLWAGPRLWSRLRAGNDNSRWTRLSARFAGALLATSSLFALWHGLGSLLEEICRAAP